MKFPSTSESAVPATNFNSSLVERMHAVLSTAEHLATQVEATADGAYGPLPPTGAMGEEKPADGAFNYLMYRADVVDARLLNALARLWSLRQATGIADAEATA